MLKRPKPKKEGEEEVQEDDENAQKPVQVEQLVKRVNETVKPNSEYYEKILELIEFLMPGLKPQEHLKIHKSLGMTPQQLVETVKSQMQAKLFPLPIQLEAGNDDNLKDLLTQNLEENEVPRKWSSFQQIDIVKLFDQKLGLGKAEFACAFAGRVFLFSTEEN